MNPQENQLVLSLIAYAAQRDISPEELCRNANIDLQAMKSRVEYVISKKQFDDLWFYSSHLSQDPLFGLHFGESLQLSALGVVGEIIKSSNTVGDAVNIAASLTHLVTDLFRMKVTSASKAFAIELLATEAQSADFTLRQMTDLLMVFVIHELDGLLLQKIKPTAVYFPYGVSDPKEYERVLRCKPSKSKGKLAIHFDIRFWEEPIISANYELQNFLLQKVNDSGMTKKSDQFADKIYHYLIANAYLGIMTLDDVASNFNVTPRSLQRRLQTEGATFMQVSDEVKKSLALQYIETGRHPIKEISYMLGYNEVSAFSRAFKRWTGKAPTSYES